MAQEKGPHFARSATHANPVLFSLRLEAVAGKLRVYAGKERACHL